MNLSITSREELGQGEKMKPEEMVARVKDHPHLQQAL